MCTGTGSSNEEGSEPVANVLEATVRIDLNAEEIVRDVIVIGASAGGVSAVIELLSRLPSGAREQDEALRHRA
jgi:chemotaxis response regulator CheB